MTQTESAVQRWARELGWLRVAVALTFVVSGAIKLLYANQGAARFVKLGIPAPALMAPFVSATEITCGVALLVGLHARWVALPLMIDMLVAIATKVPLIVGPGREPIAAAPQTGWLAFLYAARLDMTMFLACLQIAWLAPSRTPSPSEKAPTSDA